MSNYLPPARLTPQHGWYQGPNTPKTPIWVNRIQLSGWAATPQGWVPFNNINLNPAHTKIRGQCTCPLEWHVGG